MSEHDPGSTPTVVGLLATRARMTEGQLYTLVLAALVVALMTLTGLPKAHQNGGGIGLNGPPTTIVQPGSDGEGGRP